MEKRTNNIYKKSLYVETQRAEQQNKMSNLQFSLSDAGICSTLHSGSQCTVVSILQQLLSTNKNTILWEMMNIKIWNLKTRYVGHDVSGGKAS